LDVLNSFDGAKIESEEVFLKDLLPLLKASNIGHVIGNGISVGSSTLVEFKG
jgi:hypothetical protein